MALPSFLQRKPKPPHPAAADTVGDDTTPVQQARARARRRLVGAVVLLGIGVVVFPMVFETQPRPLPADIPIELPRRDPAPPRASAAPPRAPAGAEAPVAEPVPPAATESSSAVTAAPAPAAVAPAARPTPAAPAVDRPADRPAADKPTDKPAAPAPAPPPDARAAEAARARAALEGRPVPPKASDAQAARFVVQVGAYTDPATLRDVRSKVEKLGLKTYTQSVETEAGRRTRVRVGPFTTRAEADGASARLKAAGLPGNVLAL